MIADPTTQAMLTMLGYATFDEAWEAASATPEGTRERRLMSEIVKALETLRFRVSDLQKALDGLASEVTMAKSDLDAGRAVNRHSWLSEHAKRAAEATAAIESLTNERLPELHYLLTGDLLTRAA